MLVNHSNAAGLDEKHNEWVFIMCENCYWSASLANTRQPVDLSKCPFCKSNRPLAVVPIEDNELFTFSYTEKHGVELDFMPRDTP